MANGEWYYAAGGQQQGPVSLEALRQMLASGQVQPGDLVWSQGMPNWAAASTIPGLFDAPAAPSPGYPITPGYPSPTPSPYPGAIGYYTPESTYVAYAGFWSRFAAAFIDGLILVVPIGAVGVGLFFALGLQNEMPAGRRGGGQNSPMMVMFDIGFRVVAVVIGWLYYASQESGPKMATVGKRALGIIVTDASGNRISFARATGRYFSKLLSNCTCYIGYIMAAFTERKQALHDMVASTVVIQGTSEDAQRAAGAQYPYRP